MRVLLVENDVATAAGIRKMLTEDRFLCDTTDVGEDGLEIGKLYDYDIILLGLPLPDIDSYEVLRRLRAARIRTPILILAGPAESDARLKDLGFGADDFLAKPFDRRELVARIQAIVRCSKERSESTIRIGKLAVNLDRRIVTVDGKREPVHLTPKEYGILELLSLRKDIVLTKEMFLNHLYGGMDEPELGIIDRFVGTLRKKLARATGGPHYIVTVRGRGHVLSDEPHPAAEQSGKNPWTVRRKEKVIMAVRNEEISLEDALRQYYLTEEEFRAWRRLYEAYGLAGLRTTRLQQYRSLPKPRGPRSRR